MQGSSQRVLGLCAATLIAGGPALAEPPPAVPSAPAAPASTPRTDPIGLPRIIGPSDQAPPIEPVRPTLPPNAAQDLGLSTSPPLMREGAFVSSARARLVRGGSGHWYAVFDADATGRQIPPMIVLENSHLAAMERVASQEPAGTRVRISGRVTVYRDRNFLLPSAPPIVEHSLAPDAPRSDAATSSAASAGAASEGARPGDPTVEQVVAELEKALGTRKPGTGPVAGPGAAPSADDGSDRGSASGFLTARRGRIVRGADGAVMAVLDRGTESRTEGPLTLMPCQNLAGIESVVDSGGEATTFTLSGEVCVYKGRRYLLPLMYTVNHGTDIVMPAH